LRHAVFALVIVVVGATAPARAEETAGSWVHDLGNKVVDILVSTSGQPDERKAQLRDIFLGSFDVDFISQFVIGRFWRKSTPAQREEFMTIMPTYVATVYAALFANYEGDGFEVLQEREEEDGAYVRGLILRNDGPNVEAAFSISKPDGGYLIKDASIEGISLLVTKRSEFGSVLSREGLDGLIARMRKILQG
jgi:phospholipid transport system substrate-binding protein